MCGLLKSNFESITHLEEEDEQDDDDTHGASAFLYVYSGHVIHMDRQRVTHTHAQRQN